MQPATRCEEAMRGTAATPARAVECELTSLQLAQREVGSPGAPRPPALGQGVCDTALRLTRPIGVEDVRLEQDRRGIALGECQEARLADAGGSSGLLANQVYIR